jgi:multidrug efflux system membrane fusion protein
MKRLVTWIVVIAVAAGLFWWQRAVTVPYFAKHLPFTAPIFAMVPGLAEHTKPKTEEAQAGSGRGSRRGGGGPVAVVVAEAAVKNLPVTIEAVGAAQASASIAIRPRIDSQVATVEVAEGAKVEAGDRLFTLDDRATRAELAQIEAQIVKTRAQIEQARIDLDRADDLLRRNAGNQVTRDVAATALKVAEAQLAADEASRDAIRTTLSYTVITAPVSGRIGSIPVKPGSIVRAGDSQPMASVNRVDPILVSFAIPGRRINELRDAMARGPVRVDVTVGTHTLSGKVTFIENAIDVATGTITVKAEVPNAEERLWPGAFVTASVVLDSGEPTVAVPSAAVQLGQEGAFVFVVKDGKTAELRQVAVARNAGEDSVIASGLEAGERVVVDGQLRLVNGAAVAVTEPTTARNDNAAAAAPRT